MKDFNVNQFLKVLFWVVFVFAAFISALIFIPIVAIVASIVGYILLMAFLINELIDD